MKSDGKAIQISRSQLIELVGNNLSDGGQNSHTEAARACLKALVRNVRGRNANSVVLELPTHFLKGLKSGEFERIGGVIRGADGKILTHLKDAKKLSKLPMLAFMAMDLAESALLNEKLKLLHEQLHQVEGMVEALSEKEIEAAFYAVNQLADEDQGVHRPTRIHEAITGINGAVSLLKIRMEANRAILQKASQNYASSKYWLPGQDSVPRKNILKLMGPLHRDLLMRCTLLAGRERMESELGQTKKAAATRIELLNVCSEWEGVFTEHFGTKSAVRKVDHIKVPFTNQPLLKRTVSGECLPNLKQVRALMDQALLLNTIPTRESAAIVCEERSASLTWIDRHLPTFKKFFAPDNKPSAAVDSRLTIKKPERK